MAGTINQLRKVLKRAPETAALILPSSRFEIYLDMNGDGKADFAFIDSSCDFTGNGKADSFALDIGKDGEFDLYLKDSDANYVPDQIFYVEDGAEGAGVKSDAKYHDLIEGALKAPAKKFSSVMTAFALHLKNGEAAKAAIQEYADSICAELAKLQ